MKQTQNTTAPSLKDMAAALNLYTVDNLPDTHKALFEERHRRIFTDNTPEFLKNLQGYEAGDFMECKKMKVEGHDPEYYYIEHSFVLVKSRKSDVIMRLQSQRMAPAKRSFCFFNFYDVVKRFDVIDYRLRDEATNNLSRPNNIGSWTAAKVEQWQTYCEQYIKVLQQVEAELKIKNEAVENEINDFVKAIANCKTGTFKGSTEVTAKHFTVTFTHDKSNGYLSTKIEFTGKLKDVIKLESK